MTFTTRPDLIGTFGMVSSTHWLASAVGLKLLEAGGTAFDAAVGMGFVLNVQTNSMVMMIGMRRSKRAVKSESRLYETSVVLS